MAALTWRNVDSPDFRGALEGYRQSSAMLGNALDSIQNGLATYRGEQQRGADQQVMLNAMKFTDPKQYQEAYARGEITGGVDPSLITSKTLEGLANRGKQLQEMQMTNQKIDATDYDMNRTKTENALMDEARPAFAAMIKASMSGDPKQIAAVQEQFGPVLARLSGSQQSGLAKESQGLQSSEQNLTSSRWNFNNSVEDRNDSKAADAAMNFINQNAVDTTSARNALDGLKLNPSVRSAVDARLQKMYPNMYGPGALAEAAADTSIPSGSDTFTNMIGVESGGRQFGADGKVLTSPKGARSIAQIMPDTGPEAAKLAGVEWDPARLDNDPQYALKLGRAYFDQQKKTFNGDEAKAAAAYNAGPGAVSAAIKKAADANAPETWLTYLPQETQNYVPRVIPKGQVDASLMESNYRLMQNNATQTGAVDLMENLSNKDSVGKVADTLIASDFAGADRNTVIRHINKTMADSGVNAAQAAALLRRSISGASTFNPFNADFYGTSNFGNNIGVSDKKLKAARDSMKSGLSIDQVLNNASLQASNAAVDTANAAAETAKKELAAMQKAATSNPRLAGNLGRMQEKVNRTQAALAVALNAKDSDAGSRAQREILPPEQINQQLNNPNRIRMNPGDLDFLNR